MNAPLPVEDGTLEVTIDPVQVRLLVALYRTESSFAAAHAALENLDNIELPEARLPELRERLLAMVQHCGVLLEQINAELRTKNQQPRTP